MPFLDRHQGLFTDFYELTMAQGYFLHGRAEKHASFDYFFRHAPFGGSYAVFAGLGDFLAATEQLSFGADDIDYLRSLGLDPRFLEYLAGFRFTGHIWAVREGEIVFPGEPVLRVEAPIIEGQILETLLLNLINFQTLIATKTSRCVEAAQGRQIIEFGLRRAQGLGGMQATRASAIGGATATSNVYGAFEYGLAPSGTQAHSWIQSFEDELAAFRAYAEAFPARCILLLDTYNTMESGLPNALTVATELERRGHRLAGVRLDSGDLALLSKQVRRRLDEAGLHYVKIVASNQLDEHVIRSLLAQDARIDMFGVGTSLVTGAPDGALDGVYKLGSFNGLPSMKVSEKLSKSTLPGKKKILRFSDEQGMWNADAILLEEEERADWMHDPFSSNKNSLLRGLPAEPLLTETMANGKVLPGERRATEAAAYLRERLQRFDLDFRKWHKPATFPVGISPRLMQLRDRLLSQCLKSIPKS